MTQPPATMKEEPPESDNLMFEHDASVEVPPVRDDVPPMSTSLSAAVKAQVRWGNPGRSIVKLARYDHATGRYVSSDPHPDTGSLIPLEDGVVCKVVSWRYLPAEPNAQQHAAQALRAFAEPCRDLVEQMMEDMRDHTKADLKALIAAAETASSSETHLAEVAPVVAVAAKREWLRRQTSGRS